MRQRVLGGAVAALVVLTGCATTQSRYVALGGEQPPKAVDCAIDVYRTNPPNLDFYEVARLDVHRESTFFSGSDFAGVLPELKEQACLAGADGITDIQERHSSHLETRMYHVIATGIKYK